MARKYILIADVLEEDGFKSMGMELGEYDSFKEAHDALRACRLEPEYSNFDIEQRGEDEDGSL